MLIFSSNLGSWALGRIACGVLTDAIFASYTSTILSFVATMLHTYLAVAYPLHHFSFMSRDCPESGSLHLAGGLLLPHVSFGLASGGMPG